MRNKAVRLMGRLGLTVALIWSLTGCGQRVTQTAQTEAQTQAAVQVVRQTETQTQPQTQPAQTETESETQRLITSVDYTSKDGSVKITLPDNTWKVTQDADEMRVFQSGNAAIINIVHADTPTTMASLNIMRTEEDLRSSLTEQYSSEDAYEIEDYTSTTLSGVSIYRYTVKYNAAARMWAYATTNAIETDDQAYIVTGTVTDDNETLLESVKKAVESFRVLNDDTLRTVTGEVISGTAQATTEAAQQTTAATSSSESGSLTTYSTPTTLVTNDEVNVRAEPGTDSDVIDSLVTGQSVTVTGETSGWYQVSVNGATGYVRKDFLGNGTATAETSSTSSSSADSAELSSATNYGTNYTLYASSTVNLRSQPGTDSDIIGSVGAGSAVTVTGETSNWFIVNVGGTTGYISKAFLTYTNTAGTSTSTSTGTTTTTGGSTSTSGTTTTGGSSTTTTGGSGSSTSGVTSISGTVTGTTADTITVQGDDGNTYTVNYENAALNTSDGLYDGVYVNIGVSGTNADGTLSASSISG